MDLDLEGTATQNTGYVLNESLVALNKAWCTETNALEILPFKNDIIQELQEQLEGQQENIDQKIEEANEEEYFVVSLYLMDIERVRYSLARYFRTRLLKIERSLEYILSNLDIMDRLSMEEKEFATKLNNLNNSYFEDNVSNRFQHSDAKDYYETSENRLLNAKASDKHFVFCRAGTDINNLPVSVDQLFSLWKGDIGIVQYSVMKDYVANGQAELL